MAGTYRPPSGGRTLNTASLKETAALSDVVDLKNIRMRLAEKNKTGKLLLRVIVDILTNKEEAGCRLNW
jgi:hypothetical protein